MNDDYIQTQVMDMASELQRDSGLPSELAEKLEHTLENVDDASDYNFTRTYSYLT